MDGIRQYVFSIVTAALICGIISRITSECTANGLLRIVCGLVLTLAVLRPFAMAEIPELEDILFPQKNAGELAAARGEEISLNAMSDIIIETCEAYILDKANEMGADLTVSVALDQDLLPISAELRGRVSLDTKDDLSVILEKDLGITKENQIWKN